MSEVIGAEDGSTASNFPFVSITELQEYAENHLSSNAYQYFAGGAGEQITLRDNSEAFKRFKILPRYLQGYNCLEIDPSTTILGQKIAFPICASPTGFHKVAHSDGELATARACSASGNCMAVSAFASASYEEISKTSPDSLKWAQMYINTDNNITLHFIRRAENAGYKAIVITVDTPPSALRTGDFRNNLSLPKNVRAFNYAAIANGKSTNTNLDWITDMIHPSLSWTHIRWLKSVTKLPVVLKGILSPEDAKQAVRHGVDAILVSNKGGRQLDGLPTTIEMLPKIVEAVDGKLEIYLDSGVRNGGDVFKALALGARAVFLGRPVIWGLAYNGQRGVEEVFKLLRDQLKFTMGMTGCENVSHINKSLVISQHKLSSFL